MFKILRSNKGATPLLEMMAVVAIIAITGSVVVPNFMYATERARIRSDIQSTIVLQSAKDLYRVEMGTSPGNEIQAIKDRLIYAGYLQGRGLETQTEEANWIVIENQIRLDVRDVQFSYRIYNGFSQSEREVMYGLPERN